MRWLITSLGLIGLTLQLKISAETFTEADGRIQGSPDYYFWNEVTGDVQWEDPGGACSSALIIEPSCSTHNNAAFECVIH